MGFLFSKRAPAPPPAAPPARPRNVDHKDHAILELKRARMKLEQFQKKVRVPARAVVCTSFGESVVAPRLVWCDATPCDGYDAAIVSWVYQEKQWWTVVVVWLCVVRGGRAVVR